MNLTVREKLDAGKPVLGIFVKLNAPGVVELAALGGFDFVVVDCEHGNFTGEQVENLIRAGEAAGVSTMVRTADARESTILHALDSGAAGIQIPSLQNAGQARIAAQFARHAPHGRRGFARANRSASYGMLPLDRYLDQAQRIIVSIHVENREMIDEIDQLCRTPGIDMLFLGTADLSQSLGVMGDPGHVDVRAAVDRVIRAGRQYGLHIGAVANNVEEAATLIARGVNCIVWQSDIAILGRALTQVGAAFARHR